MNVAVVGLQGLDPDLVFDELADELPNLARLVDRGAHGRIESTVPPEPTPAWSVFASGRNPGQLGLTGPTRRDWKQTRQGHQATYGEARATSLDVDEPRLWQLADEQGLRSAVVGAPQTFPVEPLEGVMVADAPAGSTETPYTHPPGLADELETQLGQPLAEAAGPRAGRQTRIEAARRTIEARFDVAQHLARERSWELFFAVVAGLGAIQQAAWSTRDPDHALHEDGEEDPIEAAYRRVDERLGDLVDAFGDDTAVIVVSEAGAQPGRGALRLNAWLREEGYLALTDEPEAPTAFDPRRVDWSDTQAWARGGAWGRMHLNVAGREPEGVVDPLDYEDLRDEIRDELHSGLEDLSVRAMKPREVHEGARVDEGPDLLCSVEQGAYRCDGDLGHPDPVGPPERGRGEATPTRAGSFVLADPEDRYDGRIEGLELLDGVPTVLDLLGSPVPEALEGRALQPDGSLAEP